MKPAAPAPVHYRLAQGGGLFWAVAAALLMLGGVLLAWLSALRQAQQPVGLPGAFVAVAYDVACIWCWQTVRAMPQGWLVWTGKVWQLQALPSPCAKPLHGKQRTVAYPACALVLDLQHAVLLRLHADTAPVDQVAPTADNGLGRRACWVWASRASDSRHWHALRCALVWAQTARGQADNEGTVVALGKAAGQADSAVPSLADRQKRAS